MPQGYTYDQLRAHLLKGFQSKQSPEEYRRQLEARTLQAHESYEDYFYDIVTLCDQAEPNMPDEKVVQHLIRGLPYELAEKVFNANLSTPDQVRQELVHQARFRSMYNRNPTKELTDALVNAIDASFKRLNIGQNHNQRARGSKSFNQKRGSSNRGYKGNNFNPNFRQSNQTYYYDQNQRGNNNYNKPRSNNYHGKPRGNYNNGYNNRSQDYQPNNGNNSRARGSYHSSNRGRGNKQQRFKRYNNRAVNHVEADYADYSDLAEPPTVALPPKN